MTAVFVPALTVRLVVALPDLVVSVYCHADVGKCCDSPQEGTECFKSTLACSSSCDRDGKETYG